MKRCLKTAREIDRRIVEADIRLSSRDHFPHPVETWKWQHQPINLRVDRRQGKNQLSRSVKFYIQCMHILCRKKIARILYIYQTKKMIMIISCVQSTCIWWFFFYIQMIEIVARIVESWLKKEEVWVEMINKLNDR